MSLAELSRKIKTRQLFLVTTGLFPESEAKKKKTKGHWLTRRNERHRHQKDKLLRREGFFNNFSSNEEKNVYVAVFEVEDFTIDLPYDFILQFVILLYCFSLLMANFFLESFFCLISFFLFFFFFISKHIQQKKSWKYI